MGIEIRFASMVDETAATTSIAKKTGIGAAVGAVTGFVFWSAVGPAVISWWYEPPSKDAFSCAGSVKTALSQFVTMQLISAAIGAVGLAVILFVFRRAKSMQGGAPN
jgi:hypothetical protein